MAYLKPFTYEMPRTARVMVIPYSWRNMSNYHPDVLNKRTDIDAWIVHRDLGVEIIDTVQGLLDRHILDEPLTFLVTNA